MSDQSDTIGKLATALASVQGELRGYTEGSTNPHFKSKYGSLTEVWAAIREPLARAGLSVLQTMDSAHDTSETIIVTTLAHSSGEWVRGRLRLPLGRGDGPQAVGAAITYGRRYALAAIVGVAPEDDDAQAAADADRRRKEGARKPSSQPLVEPPDASPATGDDVLRAKAADLWAHCTNLIAAGLMSEDGRVALFARAGIEKGRPVTVAALAVVEQEIARREAPPPDAQSEKPADATPPVLAAMLGLATLEQVSTEAQRDCMVQVGINPKDKRTQTPARLAQLEALLGELAIGNRE